MKNSSRECFCALCRSPRSLRYSRHLSPFHYAQIIVVTLVFSSAAFPWLSWKSLVSLPVIWILFESVHKSLYRKDLKCPHCGFDPKWYKKDIKLARQKVEEFIKQNPNGPYFKKIHQEEKSRSTMN